MEIIQIVDSEGKASLVCSKKEIKTDRVFCQSLIYKVDKNGKIDPSPPDPSPPNGLMPKR